MVNRNLVVFVERRDHFFNLPASSENHRTKPIFQLDTKVVNLTLLKVRESFFLFIHVFKRQETTEVEFLVPQCQNNVVYLK